MEQLKPVHFYWEVVSTGDNRTYSQPKGIFLLVFWNVNLLCCRKCSIHTIISWIDNPPVGLFNRYHLYSIVKENLQIFHVLKASWKHVFFSFDLLVLLKVGKLLLSTHTHTHLFAPQYCGIWREAHWWIKNIPAALSKSVSRRRVMGKDL